VLIYERLGYPVSLRTYGGKRPPRGYEYLGAHYRHLGDIVPFLPPWRPRQTCIEIGVRLPFWEAHEPRAYYEQMRKDGVR
jgi:hypothetical protein